jgi:hypothetical protein
MLPNFELKNKGEVSSGFLQMGIGDFHKALLFVGNLPYGRNSSRDQYDLVLSELKGTCSTKHALLAALCSEHEIEEVKLYTGVYEMNESNTPGVGTVLRKYELHALPEAHCYLKYEQHRFDFTRLGISGEPINEFLAEVEITSSQIGDYKLQFHRSYLPTWLEQYRLTTKLNADDLWKIREECIKELSVVYKEENVRIRKVKGLRACWSSSFPSIMT